MRKQMMWSLVPFVAEGATGWHFWPEDGDAKEYGAATPEFIQNNNFLQLKSAKERSEDSVVADPADKDEPETTPSDKIRERRLSAKRAKKRQEDSVVADPADKDEPETTSPDKDKDGTKTTPGDKDKDGTKTAPGDKGRKTIRKRLIGGAALGVLGLFGGAALYNRKYSKVNADGGGEDLKSGGRGGEDLQQGNQTTAAESEWKCSYPPGSDVFLCIHGSYNPIHQDHLNMLDTARKFVEKKGYNVKRGFIGLTRQDWLKKKGLDEKNRFSEEDRATMVELACEGTPFEYTPEGFKVCDTAGLAKELTKSNPLLRPIMVDGADVGNSFYKNKKLVNHVIVERGGSSFHSAIPASGTFSSTSVRKALHRGDIETVRKMVPPKVADFLVENQSRLLEGLSLEDP